MGGFTDWVEKIAESGSAKAYRSKVSDAESSSMWQSLSYGANYKAAYCMSACPAGEDVIAPYLYDKPAFVQRIVKPLQKKAETVYVLPGSDAEEHVARRFKSKVTKRVGSGLRPVSIQGFLDGLPLVFQRRQARGRKVVYHFAFTGNEETTATVTLEDGTLQVQDGHQGKANVYLRADSNTWLRFLGKETNLLWAMITGKIRIKGDPRLMQFFQRCFPL